MKKLLRVLPDAWYISLVYYKHFKKFPDLKNPKTLNEKLQWLKLHDRKPEYTTMVDKHLAKEYVAQRVGDEHIVPTLAVWDSPEQIDLSVLPDQFVLKWNHDSGSIIICTDKATLNLQEAVEKLSGWQDHNGFWYGREWPYKNVKPQIIAEAYLGAELQDYRFYCFNGEPKLIYTYRNADNDIDKPKIATCDIVNERWERMPFRQKSPNSAELPPKPVFFDEMYATAKALAKDIPFLRVDFYETDKMYIGELTFYPGSGFSAFYPNEWDEKLGQWLKLPE